MTIADLDQMGFKKLPTDDQTIYKKYLKPKNFENDDSMGAAYNLNSFLPRTLAHCSPDNTLANGLTAANFQVSKLAGMGLGKGHSQLMNILYTGDKDYLYPKSKSFNSRSLR